MFKSYTGVTPNSSDKEMQSYFIFCVLVTGKSAAFSLNKTSELLSNLRGPLPFDGLKHLLETGELDSVLRSVRTGKYSLLVPCFEQAVRLNLRDCTRDELLALKGVGPKTANFFLMWTRKDQKRAVLDTHILKHLKKQGVVDVPKNTPQEGPLYERLEREFLKLVAKTEMSIKDYDFMVWESYQR